MSWLDDPFGSADAMDRDATRQEKQAAWLTRHGKGDPDAAGDAASLQQEAAASRRKAAKIRKGAKK